MSGYEESLDINVQLKKVLDLLILKQNELKIIKQKYYVGYEISVIIKIENNQPPAIYLDGDIYIHKYM